jgi:hypothetical protein
LKLAERSALNSQVVGNKLAIVRMRFEIKPLPNDQNAFVAIDSSLMGFALNNPSHSSAPFKKWL